MDKKLQAFLTEAVELLKANKASCPPSVEMDIDRFMEKPDNLDRAKDLLRQAMGNTGMFGKSYIAAFLGKVEGVFFNEQEFFYERLPGDQ